MMFFLFYYLLVSGKEIEKFSTGFIPLKPQSIKELAKETKVLVKANALGIPLSQLSRDQWQHWVIGYLE